MKTPKDKQNSKISLRKWGGDVKNIWILTAANIRKAKSQTAGMLLLVIISALLLNVGLVLLFGVGTFFDELAEELNVPQFLAVTLESERNEEEVEFVRNFQNVTEVETQPVVAGQGDVVFGDDTLFALILVSNISDELNMNRPVMVGEALPLEGDAIYIPHFMFLGRGFSIGDAFEIEFEGENFTFTIAGSVKDLYFGSSIDSIWRFFVSDEVFSAMLSELPYNRAMMISAHMTEGWNSLVFEFYTSVGGVTSRSISGVRGNVAMVPTIAAIMVVVFSFILLVVAAIVIRFRINNDIEESMVNIGVLKAMGYRNYQIISSIILQFGLVALLGGVLGVFVSQILLPVVTSIFEPMHGIPWNPAFDVAMLIITLISVMAIVLLFIFITSRRINKLHPLIALRGGLTTHNFTKNHLPLDKSRGALNMLIAFKQLFKNKKQAVMVCLIVAAVTFASVSGLSLHYNVNVNTAAFMGLFGEIPDVYVMVSDPEHEAEFREILSEHPHVERAFGHSLIPMTSELSVEGLRVPFLVVENFDYLTGNPIIEGRLPILSSEVVFDTGSIELLEKSVGDWVTISSEYFEQDFIITGIVQSMNNFFGMISYQGKQQIVPEFVLDEFYIYLAPGADAEAFKESILSLHGDIIANVIHLQAQFEGQMGAMGDIFAAVNIVIMVVVAAVVVLVLYLIIKTIIIRRKRELGIQKAIGFTTIQLMSQITLSLSPPIIFGAIIGAINGYFGFNPMFIAIVRGMGISQADMPVPVAWVVMVSVGLVALAYAVSMLIAGRIRKISAYGLVSE
ncbi:MAG: ABC transporter permease [Oscillospiraceae bacterium]|nr:ABC transporter permease [Oscillospiraceae bacterium]